MITRLPDLPDNVVGIAASGQVSATDYETVLIPAVEAALAKHDKVRLLYELSGDLTGFDPAAMWEDMKLGVSHFSAWERIAVVTDMTWIAHTISLFKFVWPCEVKVFASQKRTEAEAWITA